MNFENFFNTILPGLALYIEFQFWHVYGRTWSAQLLSKNRRTETVFHLNNILNVPVNLKENFTL